MKARSGILVLVVVTGALVAAGCVEGEETPHILEVQEVYYWFEDEYLIVNVTIQNVANFTTAPPYTADPSLNVVLTEWEVNTTPDEYGRDLEWQTFHSRNFQFFSWKEMPWRPRYYERSVEHEDRPEIYGSGVGILKLEPNQTARVEFVFQPEEEYHGEEGMYSMRIYTWVSYPRTDPKFPSKSGSHLIWTGCFNLDTPEFYGAREGAADCYRFNPEGDHTSKMMALVGPDYVADPRMYHGPPPDKNHSVHES